MDGLSESDLVRAVDYKNSQGRAFRAPLSVLLQHVANHATHHRSEIATMVTMVSASPPSTDMVVHYRIVSGQMKP